MTKSEQIRQLLERGLSTTEIAARVGVSVTYARAVRNRLRNKLARGSSEYPAERARRRERYRTDPEFAELQKAYNRGSRSRAKAARTGAVA
jgi:transposase